MADALFDASILDRESTFNNPTVSRGKRVLFNMPKNPADRATIVSVFPKDVLEIKPTIFPPRYVIPAGGKDDFGLLVLESASYYQPSTIARMPATEIQINSAALAESIVKDAIGSMWLSALGQRCPGIFWIPGAYTKESIKDYVHHDRRPFDQMLNDAREWQKRWFTEVMNGADEFWARSNGNPRSIPEDARLAAEYLGMTTKPWMANIVASQLDNCPSCGEMINKAYPVCRFCHAVIDAEKAKELNLQFAAKG